MYINSAIHSRINQYYSIKAVTRHTVINDLVNYIYCGFH